MPASTSWGPRPSRAQTAPPPFLARAESDRYVDGRGLAGSQADRLAGPYPDMPPPDDESAPYDDDLDDAWAGAGAAAVAAAGTSAPRPPSKPQRYEAQRSGRRPPASQSGEAAPRRSKGGPAATPQDAAELFGPAWEKPRRYEAYPSLRTRIGLPGTGGIPRLGVAALALVLVAVLLFFVGPMLLGLSGPDTGPAGTTPKPVASEQAQESAEPTLRPAPTPQLYTIAKGDTMLKIAKRNGLTIEELLAANPKIKNPNKIKIGQQITIPVPVSDEPSADPAAGSAAP